MSEYWLTSGSFISSPSFAPPLPPSTLTLLSYSFFPFIILSLKKQDMLPHIYAIILFIVLFWYIQMTKVFIETDKAYYVAGETVNGYVYLNLY